MVVNTYHLENERWRVVVHSSSRVVGGGGDGRVHNDRKRASRCSFSVVVKWRVVVWQGAGFTTTENAFSTGAEGGGARRQPPPSKTSTHARLRWWGKVVVLEDNNHRQK